MSDSNRPGFGFAAASLAVAVGTALIIPGCISVVSTGGGGSAPGVAVVTPDAPAPPTACTWRTVTGLANTSSGYANAMGTDAAGNIYSVGSVNGYFSWAVRKSTDRGASWSLLDTDFTLGSHTGAYGFGTDLAGHIFVVGGGFNGAWTYSWIVRTLDSTGTWNTVDQVDSGIDARAYAVGADALGTVYVVGRVANGFNGNAWRVRKSTDHGANWSDVESFQLSVGQDAAARGFARDTSGNLYAAGWAKDSNGYQHWIVRRSINNGGAWSTADDFTDVVNGSAQYAQALGIAAGPDGRLYVVGSSPASGDWIVRASLNGTSWSTVDTFRSAEAHSVAVDSKGVVYVAGQASVSVNEGTSYASVVRRSPDGGLTWETLDQYPGAPDTSSFNAITIDSLGGIYSSGALGGTDWYLRLCK